MARWRTLDEGYKLILAEDPETSLKKWALRAMMIEGIIPTITVGKKRLFDVDELDSTLKSAFSADNIEETLCKIRA